MIHYYHSTVLIKYDASGPRAKARQKLAHLKLSKFSRLCGALPSGRLSRAPIHPPSSAPHNIQQKKILKNKSKFWIKIANFERSNGSIQQIFDFPTDIWWKVWSCRWMWQLLLDSTTNLSWCQILGFGWLFPQFSYFGGLEREVRLSMHYRDYISDIIIYY